jgi:hypothetical protein
MTLTSTPRHHHLRGGPGRDGALPDRGQLRGGAAAARLALRRRGGWDDVRLGRWQRAGGRGILPFLRRRGGQGHGAGKLLGRFRGVRVGQPGSG